MSQIRLARAGVIVARNTRDAEHDDMWLAHRRHATVGARRKSGRGEPDNWQLAHWVPGYGGTDVKRFLLVCSSDATALLTGSTLVRKRSSNSSHYISGHLYIAVTSQQVRADAIGTCVLPDISVQKVVDRQTDWLYRGHCGILELGGCSLATPILSSCRRLPQPPCHFTSISTGLHFRSCTALWRGMMT